jgi:hypothetical protein
MTSNASREDFSGLYGDEIESRMHQMFNFIEVSGPDRRKS